MGILTKLIVSTLAVFVTAYIMPGVRIDGMITAICVAVVLGLLNALLKPILVILTIPITILTLGIFLLVINAAIVLLASDLVGGFKVDGFFYALLFSLVLSLITSVLEGLAGKKEDRR